MTVPLTAAYALRAPLEKRFFASCPDTDTARRQFLLDGGLLIGVGLSIALFNLFFFGFPVILSGVKIIVGFGTLGLFTGMDLALARERTTILRAISDPEDTRTPEKLSPMTRRFTVFATAATVLLTVIVIMVVERDFAWLAEANITPETISAAQSSVLLELIFVMGSLLLMIIRLILSYAKNLQILFQNQTGALERVRRGDLSAFVPVRTSDEFGVIAGHTNDMILKLRDHLRLIQGVKVAQEVQETLLPGDPPEFPGLDIAARLIYSDETGGDYYDFISFGGRDHPPGLSIIAGMTPPRRLGVAVGDVTGHGVGAALLMGSARAFLRATAQSGCLAECIGRTNSLVTTDTGVTGRFMTLFYMQFEQDPDSFGWVAAGHDPAFFYDPESDAFEELGGRDIPLGIDRHWRYNEFFREDFHAGRILVIATDGLWETTAPSGGMYGKQRLREVIRTGARAGKDAEGIADAIMSDVDSFRGSEKPEDDVTLVVIRRTADQ